MRCLQLAATIVAVAAVSAEAQVVPPVTMSSRDDPLVQADRPDARVVRVRVVDQAGRPVAGASVSAATGDGGTTDADGVGELRRIPGRRMVVAATHSNYSGTFGSAEASVVIDPGTTAAVDVVLFEHGAIAGRIVDAEQRPLAGATITALRVRHDRRGRRLGYGHHTTSTNARGDYRLGGLQAGAYVLRVVPPSQRPRLDVDPPAAGATTEYFPGVRVSSQATSVLIAAGATTDVSLAMTRHPLHRVAGRVSVGDAPLPERVTVALRLRDPDEPDAGAAVASCLADAFGSFVLPPVPAGRYVVSASAHAPRDGGRSDLSGVVAVDVSGDIDDIAVDIGPGATVRGRIRFVGSPPDVLERLQLEATATGSRGQPVLTSPIREDGVFEITGLRGRVRLAVDHVPPHHDAGRPQSLIAGVRIAGGATIPPEAAASPGVVTGAATRPSSSVRGTPSPTLADAAATTFSVPVEAGVAVSGPAWRTREVRVQGAALPGDVLDVDGRAHWDGVEIELVRDQALVAGIVRDDRGATVTGATIVALAVGSDDEALPRTRWSSRERGRYTVTAIPPGTWDVVAVDSVPHFRVLDGAGAWLDHLRSRAQRIVLAPGQRLELDLVVVTP